MAAEMKANIVYGAKGVDAVSAAAGKVQHDLEKVSKSAGRLNGAFRGMRGGAAQLGYQIQDVAVQLQSGQNALLVFGQQGSQIASIMGPGGALIGAFIAVGAAVASTFVPSLFAGSDALEDFSEKALEAANKQKELNAAVLAGLAVSLQEQMEAQQESASALNTEIANLEAQLTKVRNTTAAYNDENTLATDRQELAKTGFVKSAEAIQELERTITKLKGSQVLANDELIKLLYNLAALERGENPFYEPDKGAESLIKKTESFIEALKTQAATYGNTAMQTARYQLGLMDLTDEQIAQAERYIELIEEQTEAEKKAKEEEAARKKIEKQAGGILDRLETSGMSDVELIRHKQEEELAVLAEYYAQKEGLEAEHAAARKKINTEANAAIAASNMMAMQNSLSVAGSIVGQMASFADQSSGIGKALFVASKAIAMAETYIQYELAIAKAVGQMGIFGIPMQALLRAQQVASIAAIAGQTVAGFEGGGITFNGVRSGGLDGKGGRMAMVHPNEKITDLEKGGAVSQAPVNVSFNISAVDAKGIDELLVQRRAMITNLVNKAINNRGRSSLA